MGAAEYDGMAAGLNFLAQALMGREQDRREDKRAIAYEAALEKRELAREERALKRQQQTPVERRTFQGSADDGPPELMVDQLNSIGESVGQQPASQREKQDYAANATASAQALQAQRDKMRIDEEDRQFNRQDKETRTGIASRNAAASERRASAVEARANRPAGSAPRASKDPKDLSRKEALDVIKAFEYRAGGGESWRDVMKRGGGDPDSISAIAYPKEKAQAGAVERFGNAVGDTFKSVADRFAQKGAPVMAKNRPKESKPDQEKQSAPYPEGTKLKGKDGKIYVIRNGEPVLQGG